MLFAGISGGIAQAAFGREMADVKDHAPHLFVAEVAGGGGHAGGIESVLDDPLELAVGVSLHLGAGE